MTCMQELTSCLLGCLTLGYYEPNDIVDNNEDHKLKMSDYIIEEEHIDYVPINSKKELKGYDIEWKRASELVNKVAIFDSYNPFEIIESNFTIKNNLILFQCLSQQPWLIRKLIKPDRCRNNHYNVLLYPKRVLEKQNIDDYIPYIKERKEVMFLSNREEMWPMLLQKALAKLHNSYFALAQVDPCLLLEEVTGFPTTEINLNMIPDEQLVQFFS